ncbi:alkaline phosphatase D family protein [Flavobacterium noncentrifugens]|uniref:Alkaline phosphatase D n=1 Tax=Flavobacterium noncentrifugens TaxID=1128970 RepID=A0A1G8YUZ3_9FLAO|nr:alkaline phosphatase D family protein [Flavobacterium noncentrifugens]SDK06254.1 alkaline phosphatase D [Flavobacterium noncentrifugens]
MQKNILLIAVLLLFQMTHAQNQSKKTISKIAFGSCAEQDKPLPVFDLVVKHKPDLFIFLGDNIYADTEDEKEFERKYAQLAAKPSFQNLSKNVPVIATWDDHDFGDNDAGKEYKKKKESKQFFLDFFHEPQDSERRKRDGIYTSYIYGTNGKKVQIILLDTRYFRDKMQKYMGEVGEDKRYFYKLDYAPSIGNPEFLGEAQWQWLEKELQKDADLRIIGSSVQFGHEFNGYESWTNFPKEQQRMFDLIQKTKANGIFFISGDVHYAEISKREIPDLYPIYDFTSSGLSSKWKFATPNQFRIEGPVMENHFGLLTIDWTKKDPAVKMEIWDVSDNPRFEYTVKKSDISFKK